MVASLVGLVLLTALAIGIPSIWLIRSQLDQQTWALVEQGVQTTRAVFSARQSRLTTLAILTAQRPALSQLLQENNPDRLLAYLHTLQEGASLDLLLLCDAQRKPVTQVSSPLRAGISLEDVCQQDATSRIYVAQGPVPSGWLLSSQPVPDSTRGIFVVAGEVIDEGFLSDLRDQTGLEQIFLVRGVYLSSSFAEGKAIWDSLPPVLKENQPVRENPVSGEAVSGNTLARGIYSYGSTPYYAIRSGFGEAGFEIVLSRPVPNIEKAQQQLTRQIGAGILIVIAAGSGLGILLARRISFPLERLRNSALALRRGDLTTPVSSGMKTGGIAGVAGEIAQVAYALEDARIALYHSLSNLRQEKAWIDHLLESVVEGIFTLDRFGRVTFFSQGAERITGWKQEQVVGKPVDEIFRLADGGNRVPESFSRCLPAPGGKQALVTVLLNSRGSHLARPATLAITVARLAPPEAGRAATAVVLRDVSDEDAIRRLLGDFLANITHEFRTPLSALAASTELLLDQLPTLSPEEIRELLNSLRLGILGLQTLIDNLLEGASIEAGRFHVYPQPADLSEIVSEVIRTMQPLFDKYGLRLALAVPDSLPVVRADSRRTGQVLVNLLSNAIKWSPPGSEITLAAQICEGQVKIMIGDQGPGIAPEQRPELFRRFVHLRSSSQRAEAPHTPVGAGLGLSVVKAIVEAQHGQVGVADRAGGGAVFWFTVPFANAGLDG